ncbi:MAG: ABA4-like family protein [Planktomarina sp.]
MPPDTLFQIHSSLAMIGWLLLAFGPLAPKWIFRISGLALPALLSVSYFAMILTHWAQMEGGYDSLQNVMALLANPNGALAGWVHFLAFDLFIGAWGWQQARAQGVPHILILPALGMTFLFGPIGLLLFFALIGLSKLKPQEARP